MKQFVTACDKTSCGNEHLYRRGNCKERGIEVQRTELNLTILKTEFLLLSVNLPFTISPGEIKILFTVY